MTTTQTIDERIAERRAALAKARAERLDPLDYPRVWTQRQVNAYDAETAKIDATIADLTTKAATWAELPTLDADTAWLNFLTTARDTCSAERLTIKSPIRDREIKAQADDLEFCLTLIDRGLGISTIGPILDLSPTRIGQLMLAAGYATSGPELRGPRGWQGALPEVEARIKTLTRQRAAAQAALDAALMTDDERAQQEAESQALRDAFNAMHVRGSRDGLGYVVVDEDGVERDLATLTPIERRAFERMDTIERAYRQSVIERQLGQG